jgi:MFS family permease
MRLAFFMESLDTTILNTAVPVVSQALGIAPLSMKAVLASYTLSLAVSYSKIAGLLRQQGDNAQALDSLKQGRAIIVRLTALSPTNATWKSDLAWFDRQIAALAR